MLQILDSFKGGRSYTEIVANCSRATLQAVIRGRVELKSIIYSDGWRGYTGLVDVGYGKHLRIDHGKDEFACGRNHINGIEGFWGYVKKVGYVASVEWPPAPLTCILKSVSLDSIIEGKTWVA